MKADGVRYFLMVDSNAVFLVGMNHMKEWWNLCLDRKYWVHKVKDVELPESLSKGVSILDGELVKITGNLWTLHYWWILENDKNYARFIVFDALIVNSKSVMQSDFMTRLDDAYMKVIKPLQSLKENLGFEIQPQRFFPLEDIEIVIILLWNSRVTL